jgi:hypothetical protein
MWLSPRAVSPQMEHFFGIVGRALLVCQLFERTVSDCARALATDAKWNGTLSDLDIADRDAAIEALETSAVRKTLKAKLKSSGWMGDDDEADAALRQSFDEARLARNYVDHECIPTCIGDPGSMPEDVARSIQNALPKIRQAVYRISPGFVC